MFVQLFVHFMSEFKRLLVHRRLMFTFRMFGRETEVQIRWKAFLQAQTLLTAKRRRRRQVLVATNDYWTT